jgi:hypothetical protein
MIGGDDVRTIDANLIYLNRLAQNHSGDGVCVTMNIR